MATALRDKGYIPFFSSRLVETGSNSMGSGLLTTVGCKYVMEHEILSFTKSTRERPRPRKSARKRGGLTLSNDHGPEANSSPWAGRAAFWDDIQMYAAGHSLGGRHPVVIAGNTNIYMDAAANPATEHFPSKWEACGFRRAATGGRR